MHHYGWQDKGREIAHGRGRVGEGARQHFGHRQPLTRLGCRGATTPGQWRVCFLTVFAFLRPHRRVWEGQGISLFLLQRTLNAVRQCSPGIITACFRPRWHPAGVTRRDYPETKHSRVCILTTFEKKVKSFLFFVLFHKEVFPRILLVLTMTILVISVFFLDIQTLYIFSLNSFSRHVWVTFELLFADSSFSPVSPLPLSS